MGEAQATAYVRDSADRTIDRPAQPANTPGSDTRHHTWPTIPAPDRGSSRILSISNAYLILVVFLEMLGHCAYVWFGIR